MKWRVLKSNGETEVVEAESAYANPIGVLCFFKKVAAPVEVDAPKKKKPGKPATVNLRGFAPGKWDDYTLVDE